VIQRIVILRIDQHISVSFQGLFKWSKQTAGCLQHSSVMLTWLLYYTSLLAKGALFQSFLRSCHRVLLDSIRMSMYVFIFISPTNPPPTRLLLSRTLEQFIFSASVNRSHTLCHFYPWHIGPAHNFTILQFHNFTISIWPWQGLLLPCFCCFFTFCRGHYFCFHSRWQFNKRDCHANRA